MTLCDEYNVSISTLRWDLDELEYQGDYTKILWLYSLQPGGSQTCSISCIHRKKDACATAASLICGNDTIFIDTGSTVCHILEYMEGGKISQSSA